MKEGSTGAAYLEEQIQKAINYARQEFEMTYYEVIGVLEFCKMDIVQEVFEIVDDEEKENDGTNNE
jgi:hypothetical protein